MQVIVTAVGPDNTNLVNPIIGFVTAAGANLAEIQMYDHDAEKIFAMLLRMQWPGSADELASLRQELVAIGRLRGLDVRVWSPDTGRKARLAICTTYRPECPQAVLDAVNDGSLDAEVAVMIGNRGKCKPLAEAHGVPFHHIGDERGAPDNEALVALIDRYDVDYVVLARYMRVLPAGTCWRFAGGRIVNLHHGLLPSFKGFRPYEDAFASRMLTYGATAHFIVPELDAGEQIIHQDTFTVRNGTSLADIKDFGQSQHEPRCLVEGLRRVVDREVELHFHRVIARRG
jgi:formyltetrahydrofolate deformylase